MLVSEIAKRVKRQFGDEAGAQITDDDIIRWVNDAQREIAINNELLQVKATADITSGTREYSLPQDILKLHSIKYNGLTLQGLTIQEADSLVSTHDDPSVMPSGTCTNFWVWARTITLYPTPDANIASGLTLYYIRVPREVATTAEEPELPIQYHNKIVDYCIAQAYELDDNMDSYAIKMNQFQSGVDSLRDDSEWAEQQFYPHITSSPDESGDYPGYGIGVII